MHKNMNFNIEQTRLNNAYRQLNSDHDFHTYNKQEDQTPTYWSFLKLRIGFSILFLFFIVACSKSLPTKETKQVQSVFSQVNEVDPYTSYILEKLDLHMP